MSSTIIYEIIGWIGSALVIVSLMQRSILKLRLRGMWAASPFFVYGILIRAYPLVIVNVVVIAVHLYFLRKLTMRQDEVFSMLKLYPESPLPGLFPGVLCGPDQSASSLGSPVSRPATTARTSSCETTSPPGSSSPRPCPDDSLEIELDFVIPEYRDFKLGSSCTPETRAFWPTRIAPKHGACPATATTSVTWRESGFSSRPDPKAKPGM